MAAHLVGQNVILDLLAAGTDRWGRLVADLSVAEGPSGAPGSIASALLAAGFARVRPEFETRGCSVARLAVEDAARQAGLGIWRDREYSVIQSANTAELRNRDGQFVVVEGSVRRVGFGRSRLYLDLVPFGGPTIVIARRLEPVLERAGLRVGTLGGQAIRVRGALDGRFGPRIEIGEPAMIEILRRSGEFGEVKPRL